MSPKQIKVRVTFNSPVREVGRAGDDEIIAVPTHGGCSMGAEGNETTEQQQRNLAAPHKTPHAEREKLTEKNPAPSFYCPVEM
jgi:hypothetical protein